MANICFKANQKLIVLSRLASFFTFDRKRIFFKVFFQSLFKCCALIWMFLSKGSNNRINKIHEGSLKMKKKKKKKKKMKTLIFVLNLV